ncbi:MAG: hypothetical protein GW917_01535 [Bdellovibrionales bacterium]|nr:hypothetical protein [Bdellovibrionales bacterium]
MSLSSLIPVLLKHNQAVIQWLIVVIIAMIVYLAVRSLFKKPTASSKATNLTVGSNEQIEEILNRILEKTSQWDGAAAAGAAAAGATSEKSSSGEASGAAVSSKELEGAKKELAELKAALKEKDEKLKAAEEAAGGAAPAAAAGPSQEHLDKISELEAKLAEYEVLEDDIADLSLYKEENARLKSEVERLKGGGDPGEVEAPEPQESEDLVKEFAEAVGKDSSEEEESTGPEEAAAQESVAEEAAVAEEVASPAIEEDVSVDEASAPEVEASQAGETVEESPEEEPAPSVEAEPAAAAAAIEETPPPVEEPSPSEVSDPVDQGEVDDLFAELASSDLDTDKVVSELSDMMGADTASADEALDGLLDPDKIAKEAEELKS